MEKVKILAIDDSADNLFVLKTILTEAFPGALFIPALSAENGIELCHSEKPDVILLDIVMPEMDGYEVCKTLKANETTKIIPIIMVTAARADKESRIKALESGADAFLTKPLDESELTAQIRAMLRIKESEDRKLDEKERLEALVSERTRQLENELKERKLAEEALRTSEDKFKYIFDYSPVGKSITNPSGEINVNLAFCNMLGYTQKELQHTKWQEITHPDDIELTQRAIDSLLSGEQDSARFVKRFIHKSGAILWVDLHSSLRLDKDNKPLYLMSTLSDITQRIHAEERLRESEMRLRSTFDQSPVGSVIVGLDNCFIRCNSAFCLFLGYSEDELIGKTYLDLTRTDDRELGIVDIKLIREGKKETSTFQKRYLRKDGIIVWGEVSISLVGDADNKPLYFLTIVQDITERKLAEQALQESETLHRNLVLRLPDGIYKSTHDGKFVEVNPAMVNILGYANKEELIAIDIKTQLYFEPEDRESIVLMEQQEEMGIFRLKKKDGSEIWVEDHGWYNLDDNGNILFHEGIMRDITERKRAEEALRESEQLFRGLFNASPNAINLIDPHHPILSWPIVDCNEETCQMNGYTREELVGHSIDVLNTTEGTAEERIDFYNNLRQEGIIHREVTHRHKDGHFFPVEVSSSLVTVGGHEMILGIDRDITDRKRTEEALRESEQLFRGLFNASPDAILLIDPFHSTISWPIVDCNEAACRMNGYTRDAMIGLSIDLLNLKVGSPEERNSYLETLRQKDVFQKESFHRHKDGHVFPIEISTTIITIRGREMILGIDRDITERKRAEEELQKSYDLLNKLAAQVPGVVYQYRLFSDGSSAFPYSSPGMYDIYEVTPEEVREDASPVFTRIHPDDYDNIVETITESAHSQTLYHSEFRVILPEQGLRWRVCNAKPELLEDGSTLWYGIVSDITDRKRAEEAMNEINEFNKSLLQTIPFGMDIVDEKGNILFQSENFENIFEKETIGCKCWDLYNDDKKQCSECPLKKGIEIGKTGANESIGVLGGKVFEIIHTGMMFRGKKAMLEIFHDITERKLADLELKQALDKAQESDRLKSSFLANMSHEIRTPLNSIIGFSDLLIDPDFDADQHIEFARMINTSGNGLLSIISDIMDLSKIEAGQVELEKGVFSVQKLIDDIQKEYSFKAVEKGIELRLDPSNPKEDIYLESDDSKLRQILINFVGNAIKFTESGFIEMGIIPVGDSVKFFVKDSGIGIPEEFHDTIFERFRQVESSSTRKYGGNGLGLAISKSLVELLGGKIGMKSEKGKGSIFYFTLPLST